jgi:TonB family protein
MAFRALLFSKSSETNAAMTAACKNAGIPVDVCSDIFTAIEKGKKRAFSCVIADWADQPEASFLLKRARESAVNRDTLAVAVVDHDPTHVELRDNRLDFLIYRPISDEEADAVLAKACERMQPLKAEDAAESAGEENSPSVGAHAVSFGADQPQHSQQTQPIVFPEVDPAEEDGGNADYEEEPRHRIHAIGFRGVSAAVLLLATAFCLWRSHEIFEYLAQTPEGGFRVLRESVASLFHTKQNVALPADSRASDGQVDADFKGETGASNAQKPALGLVATESTLAETLIPLRKAADFPLPVPTVERRDVAPIRRERAAIPESMKSSAPIAPPMVVTVGPAQMMPVSAPQPPQPAVQQFNEPVTVSEEAERALLVHTVNPIYPAAALAQKLHGSVVLQARIGRDGSVEDLKIVRGYFILAQAAIAAVKQWRFQPYTLSGHAAATQTIITLNFSYPPS